MPWEYKRKYINNEILPWRKYKPERKCRKYPCNGNGCITAAIYSYTGYRNMDKIFNVKQKSTCTAWTVTTRHKCFIYNMLFLIQYFLFMELSNNWLCLSLYFFNCTFKDIYVFFVTPSWIKCKFKHFIVTNKFYFVNFFFLEQAVT